MTEDQIKSTLLEMTADIASAFLTQNAVAVSDVPAVITTIHNALKALDSGAAILEAASPLKPAVPIRKSITPDFLICLEDGKQFKSLKRHLRTKYDMSPEDYRAKWGLPKDYPMVAPNYAASRSALAKSMGLGNGGRQAKAVAAAKPARKARAKAATAG